MRWICACRKALPSPSSPLLVTKTQTWCPASQKKRLCLAKRLIRAPHTRLGKRVICTDRHNWPTERIVHAFRGQWNVEEVFRRTKKGGVVPWGPSFQWADSSLRLHTFATVLGLMLVALAKIALGTKASPRKMMQELAGIRATLVRRAAQGRGRPVTYELTPAVSAAQAKAMRVFQLERWMPALSACRPARADRRRNAEAA